MVRGNGGGYLNTFRELRPEITVGGDGFDRDIERTSNAHKGRSRKVAAKQSGNAIQSSLYQYGTEAFFVSYFVSHGGIR